LFMNYETSMTVNDPEQFLDLNTTVENVKMLSRMSSKHCN